MTLQTTSNELSKLDFIEITSNGLQVNRPMKFEEFQYACDVYIGIEEKIQVIIGDLINAGELQFGEDYAQAIKFTGKKADTIRNWVYITNATPLSRRRDGLSTISHLAELAPATEGVKIELMDWAEDESRKTGEAISARALRKKRYELMGIIKLGFSLDQATLKTGLAVWKDGEFFSGHIVTAENGREMSQNITRAFGDLSSVLPAWVAIEPVYGGARDYVDRVTGEIVRRSNPQTVIKLAKLAGSIERWCDDNNVPLYDWKSIAEIDSAVGIPTGLKRGDRKVHTKYTALPLVQGKYTGDDENVFDAVVVGFCALGEIKEEEWSNT